MAVPTDWEWTEIRDGKADRPEVLTKAAILLDNPDTSTFGGLRAMVVAPELNATISLGTLATMPPVTREAWDQFAQGFGSKVTSGRGRDTPLGFDAAVVITAGPTGQWEGRVLISTIRKDPPRFLLTIVFARDAQSADRAFDTIIQGLRNASVPAQ